MGKGVFADIPKLLHALRWKSEDFWLDRGNQNALHLFNSMSARVPAYKDFLNKHNVNVGLIRSIDDFKYLPILDKDNYLRAYDIKDLCWDGKFDEHNWVISATSGSTGEPYYFPRTDVQDKQYAINAELYLLNNFQIDRKSTLYINCFAMGIWIGGVFTYQALKHIAQKAQYNITIANPGTNKKAALDAIRHLGGEFDQVIIGGYPPFVKDLIDDGEQYGVNWFMHDIGFIFSAEGFTEDFRDYFVEKTSLINPLRGTLNHYGTVDMGTMAHETPLSIMVRRLALHSKDVYAKLLSNIHKLPTICQYLPEFFYFEQQDNGLICSSFSGIPLMRYDLKDSGGIFTFSTLFSHFNKIGLDLSQLIKDNKIQDTIWRLPFVFLYERKDFVVTLYGVNIYPETIRKVLIYKEFQNYITGKCQLEVDFDQKQNQFLCIYIEKRPGVIIDKDLSFRIKEKIIKRLLLENSEYYQLSNDISERTVPKIIFCDYEDSTHFSTGGKQKW
ncbi:hypothetical protein KKG82_05310, partial [Patescibacteria group bacterium]|nr:hypothetical protein [Patescibacteria group bacterium]